jgi:hypothetical protein
MARHASGPFHREALFELCSAHLNMRELPHRDGPQDVPDRTSVNGVNENYLPSIT